MKMVKSVIFSLIIIICCKKPVISQQDSLCMNLSIQDVISIATDSSLQAFIAENLYLADYWQFKTYQAQRLPFLYLASTPINFSRTMKQEYNSSDSSYQYIDRQIFSSDVNLSLNQNITQTGGKIYIDTDLGRLENLNSNRSVQYSTTPLRIGLSQQLFGFNRFKWEKKIEPLKFEKAKKELVESIEDISLVAVRHFFELARAQINLEIAKTIYANADTLYNIGQKRFKIASISQEDLYTLKLELINSENAFYEAKTQLKRAKLKLYSFLRLTNNKEINLILPQEIPSIEIDPGRSLELAKANNPEILDYARQNLESERDVEQAKKNSRFNANLNASFGLNQRGNSISEAYRDPLDQEIVQLSFDIPIIDWGLAKGRYNLAKKNRDVLLASLEQSEIDFEQNIIMMAEEYNIQENLVKGAAEADIIAQKAYELSKKRFMIGQTDVIKLTTTQRSSISAKKAYIDALERYWQYYYTIRKLTLYDFEKDAPLTETIDLHTE